MARVRFIADFDYKPTQSCTIAYKAGMMKTVKRNCAYQAISAGKAIEIQQEAQHGEDKIGG
ncbi:MULTISPECIES: hypothetical protein [unclassified Rhizobium]|uniref:hypothetical protein n=1 Tax=unclassified Rhizobium TaxID=2613769 RepID=UPI001ADB255B|nr:MULTISPECIES: hypothetical protein [unclassified Rhizobium]MBO9099996.1 hypothetical protein [Rhizobium sp. L58/93]QXZ82807.1 hypothetical protein J5287_12025 [Rhizobium sp. K1/93]QXZ89680.1 hypothetical protein J5280_16565 [Rhizobium sp. K15/93]